jgi:Flp pilus assembly protein TadG
LRRRAGDRQGQVIAIFALGLVGMIGMAAFVVDVGRFYLANRQLQASSDAVSTSLANQLQNVRAGTETLGQAEANAATYGAASNQKNKGSDMASVSLTFTPKCLTVNGSVPAWCNTASTPNAVTVTQGATVTTVFAKVVGITSTSISATSTAKMGGGKPFPAHVMIVVDRTGSMSSSCSAGGTKLTCAKNGVDSFLAGMDPAYDKVGLVVLPPASNSGACAQPKTSDGPPNDYDVYTNGYVVVGLSTDYKSSASSSLNQSSTLVSDINCLKAGGTTAYATAIDQAQSVLAANHSSTAQDAIIFFTDGEADYGPCVDANNDNVCDNNSSTYRSRPCYQAQQSAAAAKSAGTWIYTVLYDTSSSTPCTAWKSSGTGTKLGGGSGSCNVTKGIQFLVGCNETPAQTAYGTVQTMATDSSKFYYSPNPSSLTTIFQDIADDLGGSRIVDENYTGS